MAELTPITPSSVVHHVRKVEPESQRKQRREKQQPDDASQDQVPQDEGPAQHIDEIV